MSGPIRTPVRRISLGRMPSASATAAPPDRPAINQMRDLRAVRPGEAPRTPETMVRDAIEVTKLRSSALAVAERMRSVAFALVTSLQLPPDNAAAARARRFVSDTMRSWGCDDAIPDAELLVSELVTNAVLHARSATRVTIEREGPRLRVSGYDTGPTQPRRRELGPARGTG